MYAATWMGLENMLNDISQTQKDKYYIIPLTEGTQNRQVYRDRKQNGSYQGWEQERMGSYCLIGYRFHVGDDEKVWVLDSSDDYRAL